MSGNKDLYSSTKVPVDDNSDSGFLSGPLSEQLLSEEFPKVDSDSSTQVTDVHSTQLDSGFDLSISEQFSNFKLSETGRNNFDDVSTPTAQAQPTLNIIKDQDDRPLAFLFQQDDDGDTQLHIAAVHGCEKSVGTLVKVCPDQEWYNVPNDVGQTALHLAALSGHAVVTRMLVLAGASISIRDLAGETPLHLAAASGHNECLQALLAPLSNEPHRRLSATLNQKNYNGQKCVHLAAMAGHVDVLQTLVYYGADINAREGLSGRTALHIAAARGDSRTAAYLLDRCAGVAATTTDYAGRTPRRLALRTGIAHLFQEEGSDSESDDDDLSYDSDQSLFDKLREGLNPINVA